MVDLDPAMTNLAKTHPVLLSINQGAFHDERVEVVNRDASTFLDADHRLYGVIIVDLPDPDTIDLMHVYSKKFYDKLRRHLIRGGVMVTQATSPYFSHKAFLCILKTVRSAGFSVLPYHNQIPTMGEWGWVMGIDESEIGEEELKLRATELEFSNIKTRFINRNAVISMVHFGKGVLEAGASRPIRINTEVHPVLYRYYLSGTWGVY